MNDIDWSLLFDELLLFSVATLKLLLWLILRRRTAIGRAIASSTLAMSIVYYGALLAVHFAFFRSDVWRVSIRALVALTTAYALWAIAGYFGGLKGLVVEIRGAIVELWTNAVETWAWLFWRARQWRK